MAIVNLLDTKVKRKLSLVLGAASLVFLMQTSGSAMQEREKLQNLAKEAKSESVSGDEVASLDESAIKNALVALDGKTKITDTESDLDRAIAIYNRTIAEAKSLSAKLADNYDLVAEKVGDIEFAQKQTLLDKLKQWHTDMGKLKDADAIPAEFLTFLQDVHDAVDALKAEDKYQEFQKQFAMLKDAGTQKYKTWLESLEKAPEERSKTSIRILKNIKILAKNKDKVEARKQSALRRDARADAKTKLQEMEKRESGAIVDGIDTAREIIMTAPSSLKANALKRAIAPLKKETLKDRPYFKDTSLAVTAIEKGLAIHQSQPVYSAINALLGASDKLVKAHIAGKADSEKELLQKDFEAKLANIEAVAKEAAAEAIAQQKAAEEAEKQAQKKLEKSSSSSGHTGKSSGGRKDEDSSSKTTPKGSGGNTTGRRIY